VVADDLARGTTYCSVLCMSSDIRRGQVLRHRTAKPLNGAPHDLTDLEMRGVGAFFAVNPLATQLFLRLGCAEEIRR
jgi:hypothetical protein